MSKCRHAAGGRSLRLGGLAAYQVVESLGLPKAGISSFGESTQEFLPLQGSSLHCEATTGLLKCLKVPTTMQLPMLKKDNLKQKEQGDQNNDPKTSHIVF